MRPHYSKGLAWIAVALLLAGCGKKDEAAPDAAAPAADTTAAPAVAGSWTPEALEELLAPVALYPDVVLGHVLTASTNPQEVLDAGNWLIENQDLPGDQLDTEAGKLGLSPSVRALVQFPEVMDLMCMKMDWTTELGQAFTADQAAVLDAVQRLRMQAKDMGNLESSAQLKVETQSQDGKEIVTVEPPNPDVVYVPKYDPTAVYAPPPANIPPPSTVNVTAAPGTTTTVTSSGTTTTVASEATATEAKGHSTGTLITTGLLAFGAGLLVNEVFDDDDDWDDYGPNYYHGGMYYGGRPYYPPPPYMYRPPYGNGYYPGHSYNRPPNYQNGFNNNTIIVNNGGNNYWNKYDQKPGKGRSRQVQSPITAANPRRSDLDNLNRQAQDRNRKATQPAARDAARDRPAAQGGYAGARPENKAARDKMVAKAPPTGVARDLPTRPKTEYKGAATSEYKGAANRPSGAKPAAGAKPATRPQQRPASAAGNADRGRDQAPAAPKAQAPKAQAPQARPAAAKPADRTAFNAGSGAQAGNAEKKASQRGHSSMGGGGGGGGGGKKPRKPKH